MDRRHILSRLLNSQEGKCHQLWPLTVRESINFDLWQSEKTSTYSQRKHVERWRPLTFDSQRKHLERWRSLWIRSRGEMERRKDRISPLNFASLQKSDFICQNCNFTVTALQILDWSAVKGSAQTDYCQLELWLSCKSLL